MTDERAPEAPRDDADVRDVMVASRTEEMVPSGVLRAMGMKVIEARGERDALTAENARLCKAMQLVIGTVQRHDYMTRPDFVVRILSEALTMRADGGS